MKKNILFLLALLFIMGCEKFKEETELIIMVMDVDTWEPGNPSGDIVKAAPVKLLPVDNPDPDNPRYYISTSAEGEARFTGIAAGSYYVLIEKEDQSNVINPEMVNSISSGFLIKGIFQNQDEVDESTQPDARVGGPVYIDRNGDGKYDVNDKLPGNEVSISGVATFTMYIAQQNQMNP